MLYSLQDVLSKDNLESVMVLTVVLFQFRINAH